MNRPKLPVEEYESEIVEVLVDHQVLVVSAETGSGKSTQIPQMLHRA